MAVTDALYRHLLPKVDEGILAAIDAALADIDIEALTRELVSA